MISTVALEDVFSNVLEHKLWDILSGMGDASYATYLTHWYVIVAFRKIASGQLGLFDFYSNFGVTLTLLVSLLVGQLTYHFIDKPLHISLKAFFTAKLAKHT
ncbi:hypothetical protein [Candidatus Methylobacter oryzae]|uniref:Acyltransferase 3 domain-containing protein n=1 Tax=Candidatus Methylobacter oryzae TaxID=2497749 RepID=A0ABY3CEQ3_9GAMM|nr:hypothetical protein [Candidatus Methylobacter oryzae]TRX01773.1 hypothetical protein EKO24_003300 [Candidatus Methylobacter oryzae]